MEQEQARHVVILVRPIADVADADVLQRAGQFRCVLMVLNMHAYAGRIEEINCPDGGCASCVSGRALPAANRTGAETRPVRAANTRPLRNFMAGLLRVVGNVVGKWARESLVSIRLPNPCGRIV